MKGQHLNLKEVIIKNYQVHRELKIKFRPGVNIIYGDTDVGKSAILRAIYWVIFNKPAGDADCTWETGETSVRLIFADGLDVTKTRSSAKTKYIMNGEEFPSAGRGAPPEPIQEALNFSELSFQHQFDPVFMLGAETSDGEVARALNEAAHLEMIDTATKNINAIVRKISWKKTAAKEGIEQLETRIKKYDFLESMEEDVQKLGGVEKELKHLLESKEGLCRSIDSLRQIKKDLDQVSPVLHAKKLVDELRRVEKSRSQAVAKARELRNRIRKLEEAAEAMERARGLLGAGELVGQVARLSTAIRKLEEKKRAVISAKRQQDNLLAMKALISKIRQSMPKTCPECGRPL